MPRKVKHAEVYYTGKTRDKSNSDFESSRQKCSFALLFILIASCVCSLFRVTRRGYGALSSLSSRRGSWGFVDRHRGKHVTVTDSEDDSDSDVTEMKQLAAVELLDGV